MHHCRPIVEDPISRCLSQLPPTQPLICSASQPAGQSKASSLGRLGGIGGLRSAPTLVYPFLTRHVAKGSSLRVLFHGLDTSRRSAFQSSAEACYTEVSDSEALTHLAHAQHLWQSKLFGSSKAWPSGGLDCVQRCN